MTRKSNGEGTIYQDRQGRWHAKVWMGLKDDGTPDRRHVTGAKRADVAAKKKELERKRDQGAVDAAGRAPTVQA